MQQKEVFACALMMAKVVIRWTGREDGWEKGRFLDAFIGSTTLL